MDKIYTDQWHALGIVSADNIAEDATELMRGDDPHPEHYRWRRFVKFIHSCPAIDARLAVSLYELCERDLDSAMGESMITVILRRDDCPRELFERALRSPSKHLKRVAVSRLGPQNG
ncbi:MAG: hypothetical protein SFY80_02275 [Verrucomicrobiota bacterium]|nr:hypothetical protein [Verrucomicrobiota bacterium]